ncbi:MAG: hypothetical protein ACPGC2_00370 [Flavobacteriaceae bacterium]
MISPARLVLASFLMWLIPASLVEATYLYAGNVYGPTLLLAGYILFFFLGYYSIKKGQIKKAIKHSPAKIKQITSILLFLGTIGVLIEIYIGFFITEIFTSTNTFDKRLELFNSENSSGVLGLISSPLYPLAFISFLITIHQFKLFSKLFRLTALTIGMYGFYKIFFVGGRTTIVFLLTIVFFVLYKAYIDYNKKGNLIISYFSLHIFSIPKQVTKRKVYTPTIIVVIAFVAYSINIINSRVNYYGYGDNVFAIWEQKDYQWVDIDDAFKQRFYAAKDEEKNKILGWYSLKHYFAHGVYEYIRLANDLSPFGHYYGQYEFNVPFKFFRALGIPFKSFSELNEIVKRQAVYSTFFGPFFVDFGVFGLGVLFFVGRMVKRVFVKAQYGSIPHIILYAYISLILLSSFLINFLMGASFYYLFGIIATMLLFKFYPNNLRFIVQK